MEIAICSLILLGVVLFVRWAMKQPTPEKKAAARKASPAAPAGPPLLPGGDRVDVVGESHYQDAIEAAAGGRTEDGANVECVATLQREPDNAFDKHAVMVLIDGRKVGYLSREDAKRFGKLLKKHGGSATCAARIVGGWDRGRRGRGSFGVQLGLARP